MATRIELTDTTFDAIYKLSEGNPGAATVCARMLQEGGAIDPDAFGNGLANLLSLDTHGIYGSRIWMLYKDACGESLIHTIAMLRAVQLELITEDALNHAIDNRGDGLDVGIVLATVHERLPNFGPATEEE